MKGTHKMRWGILSTGTIAKNFAQTAGQMPDVQMQAVASRSAGKAPKAFAKAYAIPTAHDSYEALANDPNVEIVYVATPHSRHCGGHEAADSARASMCSAKRASPSTRNRRRKSLRWLRKKHVFRDGSVLDEVHPAVSADRGDSRNAESWAKSARSRRSTAIPRRGRHASLTRRWQAARCWISACMPSALPA